MRQRRSRKRPKKKGLHVQSVKQVHVSGAGLLVGGPVPNSPPRFSHVSPRKPNELDREGYSSLQLHSCSKNWRSRNGGASSSFTCSSGHKKTITTYDGWPIAISISCILKTEHELLETIVCISFKIISTAVDFLTNADSGER